MIAKTKDGYPIELGLSDMAHPPMPPGETYYGQKLNTGALWIRLPGDDWYRVKATRSQMSTSLKINKLDLIEVKALTSSDML